jgi:hypothetical protein
LKGWATGGTTGAHKLLDEVLAKLVWDFWMVGYRRLTRLAGSLIIDWLVQITLQGAQKPRGVAHATTIWRERRKERSAL